MNIMIIGLNNFDGTELIKIRECLVKGEAVINSNLFKLKILAGGYTENRGMSNLEIYNTLMGGTIIKGQPQGDMELDITGYRDNSSTIGWTNVFGLRTHFNAVFLDKYDASEIFHNIVHEYAHTLGFIHKEWWHRSKSVPYQTGYKAGETYRDFEKAGPVPSFMPSNDVNLKFVF